MLRRDFLSIAASSVLSAGRPGSAALLVSENAMAEESLRGYRRHFDFEVSPAVPADRPLIVVPGLRNLTEPDWSALRASVWKGVSVVLESGLAFASDAEVARQRADLQKHFGIRIAPQLFRTSAVRYIRFHWPLEVLVRDFSESVSVDPRSAEPIATAGAQVAAVRRRLGRGNVVYLGSPLGPMLLADDPQAVLWVRSITRPDGSGRQAP